MNHIQPKLSKAHNAFNSYISKETQRLICKIKSHPKSALCNKNAFLQTIFNSVLPLKTLNYLTRKVPTNQCFKKHLQPLKLY